MSEELGYAPEDAERSVAERARARRPQAIAIYRELTARKRAGKVEKGDAPRLRAARMLLRLSGGLPKAGE